METVTIYFTAKNGAEAEIKGDLAAIESIEHAFVEAGIKYNEQIGTWDEGFYDTTEEGNEK